MSASPINFLTTEMSNYPTNECFLFTILLFFYGILPGKGCPRDDLYQVDVYPITKVKHLVDLAHNNWLPSPAGIEAYRNNGTKNSDWTFIYSATEI